MSWCCCDVRRFAFAVVTLGAVSSVTVLVSHFDLSLVTSSGLAVGVFVTAMPPVSVVVLSASAAVEIFATSLPYVVLLAAVAEVHHSVSRCSCDDGSPMY